MIKENKHSIYTQCWECGERGINVPENISCANCNSFNTSCYYAEEDLEFGLDQRKKDQDQKSKIASDFLSKKLQEAILENLKAKPLEIGSEREEFLRETFKKIIEPHILYAESFECNASTESNGADRSVQVSMTFKNPSLALREMIEDPKK